MLKYLARYLTGGPISDRRLISHADGEVTFWARSKNKKAGNPSRPFTLRGTEFTRRWALHILPKGITKSRCYGGFSSRVRREYLSRCRMLLTLTDGELGTTSPAEADEPPPEFRRSCPHCDTPLKCIRASKRPSWRDLFNNWATCPAWYGYYAGCHRALHHGPREPDG
ncbi:MAG: transposase [Pirellulaceae bacterium]|nr:transposase [Pirellulaceae bacterium]